MGWTPPPGPASGPPSSCAPRWHSPTNQHQLRYPDNEALRIRVMENNGLTVIIDIEASLRHGATLSNPSLRRLNGDDIRMSVECWRSIDVLPIG